MRAHAIVTTVGHRCGSEASFTKVNADGVLDWASSTQPKRAIYPWSRASAYNSSLARFSHRIPYPISSNSYTQQIAALRKAGAALLDLTVLNPSRAFADYPHDLIHHAFADVHDFTYEPHPFGTESAREAVASYYDRRSLTVHPERIVLTASTSEGYAILFKLLCDPGEEVLIPSPSYPLFEYLAFAESISAIPYRLNYDGAWYIDFEDLQKQITSRTRAIVIVNPNNPTGTSLTSRELDKLVLIAHKMQIPIISDEVFTDYPVTPRCDIARTLIEVEDVLSFSLNGLSKVAGMPQVKLGWLVTNGPGAEQFAARERLEILCDTYLSVNAPAQSALPALLSAGEMFQKTIGSRLEANLQCLDKLLIGSAASRLQFDGGWSAIVRLPGMGDEQDSADKLLTEESVVVQPGYLFDLPTSYIVISLLTNPEEFEQGVAALCRLTERQLTQE